MLKLMNVTRLFAAALIIGFCGSTLMAKDGNEPNKPKHQMRQQQRPMRDPVEGRLQAMTKQLDLTKEQQGAIKPILQDQVKQMQTLKEDKALAPEQRREKMQAIMKETNAKIESQLTPAQKEKFTKQQEQRREIMQQRRAEHKKPAVPDSNSKK